MFVHLLRENWTLVSEALGDSLPQARARIADALVESTEAIVAVEGRPDGWRAVSARLMKQRETEDVGRMVRLMCCAAETELW